MEGLQLLFCCNKQTYCLNYAVSQESHKNVSAGNTSAGDQQLQCYACGLPKVSPENDVLGSYGTGLGKKMYNHSCSEMYEQMGENKDKVPHAFVRTCPIGVKSCFGAWGFYDHRDEDPTNDLGKRRIYGC